VGDPIITEDADSAPTAPGSRALAWLGAGALLLLVFVLFMHVFAPTIAPDEAPPSGHPQSACIACHMVSGSAGDVESR
jgi:hypothetical protein